MKFLRKCFISNNGEEVASEIRSYCLRKKQEYLDKGEEHTQFKSFNVLIEIIED
jgi:hypothetical protein